MPYPDSHHAPGCPTVTSDKRFYYKQNRLKQLRAFCFAAQERSISRAAERMFLSQPSVSLQVRALEDEMGIVLFERRGPRIQLRPMGRCSTISPRRWSTP